MKELFSRPVKVIPILALTVFSQGILSPICAAPVPGGTLDPLTIPKYVTPLVIPPEMPKSTTSPAPAADYDIAVRQFKQQILPGGIWNTLNNRHDSFGATKVWSYGRASDPLPNSSSIPGGAVGVAPAPSAQSSFNYPAFTIEVTSQLGKALVTPTKVRWINDLVKDPAACAKSTNKSIPACNYLPHMFPVDQTLHWANPPKANCAPMMMDGMVHSPNRTDCNTEIAAPYTGPVPLVTHVHGAHVQPDSDGYPEAWWLPGPPGTKGIPLTYANRGTLYTQANYANTVPGSAFYAYENTQPASTLWYHDHALGMTRLNVYAGPAGFWLIRGGANDTGTTGNNILPGPAPTLSGGDPNFDALARNKIREIPIAIQDRSFNADGSLFYPTDRSFFDGFTGPYIGNSEYDGPGFVGPSVPGITPLGPSDISGIWNPEAFSNTIVVNGTTWPNLEVAPARYRLRLLDGCNSRTLNLTMFTITGPGNDGLMGTADDTLGAEVPFYQIGAEQGFLPKVVKITKGFATPLPGDGSIPTAVAAPFPQQGLLMGPAERADVIVDFGGMANGTRIRIFNTAPDAPFQGFNSPEYAPADPDTTGQVMDFIVNTALPAQPTDTASTPPENLILPAEAALTSTVTNTRQVSLNEVVSNQVCVEIDSLTEEVVTLFSKPANSHEFAKNCLETEPTVPGNVVDLAGPRQALLGVLETDHHMGMVHAIPKLWSDPITETPFLNSTEIWEIYNTTMDAHPIHLHLVRFEVVDRQDLDMMTMQPIGTPIPASPNEKGYKDTVIAYPDQITRIKAKFDIAGLYVWHCHIVEHEDNEMMRPYVVRVDPNFPDLNGDNKVDRTDLSLILAEIRKPGAKNPAYDLNNDGKVDLLDTKIVSSKLGLVR